VAVDEGADMAEAPVTQRVVNEGGGFAERDRRAASPGPLGGLGEDRQPLDIGGCGRGVMEVHEQRQVPLSVDQVGQNVAEVCRPGMVELSVDGDDNGSLVATDDDPDTSGLGRRRGSRPCRS